MLTKWFMVVLFFAGGHQVHRDLTWQLAGRTYATAAACDADLSFFVTHVPARARRVYSGRAICMRQGETDAELARSHVRAF